MIYVAYILVASLVVFCSIKCANYVDLLDKKTHISGAFIGGIILAAITSLPELITSLSSIFVVKNPELIIGNVLGSNIFNLAAISCLILFTVVYFPKASVAKSHLVVIICTIAAYILVGANIFFNISFKVLTIDLISIAILGVYIISFKFLSDDDISSSGEEEKEDTSDLTVKQVVVRFVIASVCLIAFSVVITYITDLIADDLNLNASLAGALFLGVATSLPELTSCIALAKLKNYNAMCGNIVGSNMFNFTILFVADIFMISGTPYYASSQSKSMLIFGFIASIFMAGILLIKTKQKNKSKSTMVIYGLLSLLVLCCYFGFILTSVN